MVSMGSLVASFIIQTFMVLVLVTLREYFSLVKFLLVALFMQITDENSSLHSV